MSLWILLSQFNNDQAYEMNVARIFLFATQWQIPSIAFTIVKNYNFRVRNTNQEWAFYVINGIFCALFPVFFISTRFLFRLFDEHFSCVPKLTSKANIDTRTHFESTVQTDVLYNLAEEKKKAKQR